jgi:tetratricopeptide (TPR) repeat protein
MFTKVYDRAKEMCDRALAAAERAGLVHIAAEALGVKGTIAQFQGRQWEARALLEGSRLLAEEHNLPDVALRSMNFLAATVAHDDPAEALRMERAAIELARQLGQRGTETLTLGNAAEDARRTGDWTWAIDELEAGLELDLDDNTRLTLRAALALLRALQGRLSNDQLDDLLASVSTLDDSDVDAVGYDVQGMVAFGRGEFRFTHDMAMRVADQSDLNAPYALPRAAHAAVLASDPTAAREALARLDDLGTRGRAVDADRHAVRAGIAAIEGDPATALAGYRAAIDAFRDLGLPWDEALAGLSAAIRLGPDAPGVREWVESARATFLRLEAAPFVALLDRIEGGTRSDAAAEADSIQATGVQGMAS